MSKIFRWQGRRSCSLCRNKGSFVVYFVLSVILSTFPSPVGSFYLCSLVQNTCFNGHHFLPSHPLYALLPAQHLWRSASLMLSIPELSFSLIKLCCKCWYPETLSKSTPLVKAPNPPPFLGKLGARMFPTCHSGVTVCLGVYSLWSHINTPLSTTYMLSA